MLKYFVPFVNLWWQLTKLNRGITLYLNKPYNNKLNEEK